MPPMRVRTTLGHRESRPAAHGTGGGRGIDTGAAPSATEGHPQIREKHSSPEKPVFQLLCAAKATERGCITDRDPAFCV